jgi:hypothetical protein
VELLVLQPAAASASAAANAPNASILPRIPDLDAGDLDAGDLDAGDLDAGDLDVGVFRIARGLTSRARSG